MSVTIPSERNFAIYHRSLTDGCSRTQVAAEFQLSPTRVQQIVQQVQVWVCRHGSREFAGLSGPLLHLAAMRISLERLAHTRQAVRQQWEELKQQELIVRTQGTMRESTLRPAYGALKIIRECSRLSFDELKITRELAAYETKLIGEGTIPPAEIDWVEVETLACDEDPDDVPALPGEPSLSGTAPPADEFPSDEKLDELDPAELYQLLAQMERSRDNAEPPAASSGESSHTPDGDCMKSASKQDSINITGILDHSPNDVVESLYDAMQRRKRRLHSLRET